MIDTHIDDRLTQARARSWMSRMDSNVAGTPIVNPLDRDKVPPADSYRQGDSVWVYRHGSWNPGRVRAASVAAVLVDYHLPGEGGTLTDTVPALYVMARDGPHLPGADGSTT